MKCVIYNKMWLIIGQNWSDFIESVFVVMKTSAGPVDHQHQSEPDKVFGYYQLCNYKWFDTNNNIENEFLIVILVISMTRSDQVTVKQSNHGN